MVLKFSANPISHPTPIITMNSAQSTLMALAGMAGIGHQFRSPSICPSSLNFDRHNQRQKRKNARRAHAAGSKKAFR